VIGVLFWAAYHLAVKTSSIENYTSPNSWEQEKKYPNGYLIYFLLPNFPFISLILLSNETA